jgi:dihydrofolate synthase / folylpolyglutamate synthase
MNYKETLDYLYTTLPMFQRSGGKAVKKGLDNTLALCNAVGNPHQQLKVVHVAGTNGKGSVSHMLAAVLARAGYKVGLYTSPHLLSFTERIRVNGKPVSENAVVNFVDENREHLERIKPSFFETTVAMAFREFVQQQVDIAVVEVGLGGRLDSTNVVTPLLSVITNIGYDHMDLLGDTLPEIAGEKAGIIKPNVPVVIGERHPETEAVFKRKASRENARIFFAEDYYEAAPSYPPGYIWLYHEGHLLLNDLDVSVKGDYQLKNIPVVMKALDLLGQHHFNTTREQLIYALGHIQELSGLRGRWETLQQQPRVIADVAHNAEGLTYTLRQLQQEKAAHLHFVIGMVNDKPHEKVLPLFPEQAGYYFCAPDLPRALPAGELKEKAAAYGLAGKVYPSVKAALTAVIQLAGKEDIIYVGGSSFVVAEALAYYE